MFLKQMQIDQDFDNNVFIIILKHVNLKFKKKNPCLFYIFFPIQGYIYNLDTLLSDSI